MASVVVATRRTCADCGSSVLILLDDDDQNALPCSCSSRRFTEAEIIAELQCPHCSGTEGITLIAATGASVVCKACSKKGVSVPLSMR